MSIKCKISDYGCVYHACMSDDCQKKEVLKNAGSWGPGNCKKKIKTMKCTTKYCRNDAAPGRIICHKCRSRNYKKAHPVSYNYNVLRNNARRRGKEFLITFREYQKFCNETGYIDKKGTKPDSLSIDRIQDEKGYSIDNIQALSLAENTRKNNERMRSTINNVPF